MELNERQKKHLRRLGHALHPLVTVGQDGLTDGVAAEMTRALADHELVKARARVGDRAARDQAFTTLATRTGAQLIQRIGHVGLFYRQKPGAKRLILPD